MSDDLHFKLLQQMDGKLDTLRVDLSKVSERIATVEERSTGIDDLEKRVHDHGQKINDMQTKIAPLWAAASAIFATVVGYLSGFWKGHT